jgi:hypothetical protein
MFGQLFQLTHKMCVVFPIHLVEIGERKEAN